MEHSARMQTVQNYFSFLGNKDAENWVKLFSQDAVTYDPVGNPPNQVQETYQDFFKLLGFYEKIMVTPGEIFLAGNEAAVQWQMSVTAKNGKAGQVAGIAVFTFDDADQITQMRSYWDEDQLMAQLR